MGRWMLGVVFIYHKTWFRKIILALMINEYLDNNSHVEVFSFFDSKMHIRFLQRKVTYYSP